MGNLMISPSSLLSIASFNAAITSSLYYDIAHSYKHKSYFKYMYLSLEPVDAV